MTAATTIRTSPPTLWCRETNRVIQELFWGGWACYEGSFANPTQLNGRRAGVAETYSRAQRWLFGNDFDDNGTPNVLEVVAEDTT